MSWIASGGSGKRVIGEYSAVRSRLDQLTSRFVGVERDVKRTISTVKFRRFPGYGRRFDRPVNTL